VNAPNADLAPTTDLVSGHRLAPDSLDEPAHPDDPELLDGSILDGSILDGSDVSDEPTPFAVRIDATGPHVEIRATGDLDLDTAPVLAASVAEALELADAGGRAVRLDLRDIEFIDSTGLRALLAGQVQAASAGVDLGVDGLSAAARRLLELTDTLERLRRGDR
jgi:anti-anti-sigma factor